jgi:4-hydroxy-2-oxovalerate aldolase
MKPLLLDTTLREGSYVVNFQFTLDENFAISRSLDRAGVDYIETGHGLGLGAERRYGQAESDLCLLEVCQDAIKRAKWGMFFIPGIGNEKDILTASNFGMNFIRIGTNINEVRESEKYIKLAKDLGLEVFSNFMKTYALSSEEVLDQALVAQNFGSDYVCVVDSAGYMTSAQVNEYVSLLTANLEIPVGFHGHNNLGLATSNSITAIQSGAKMVDGSLRGIGRSAGNAATEVIAFLLKRLGLRFDFETLSLLDISERYIDEIIKNHQFVDSLGIVSGFSGFHSGFESKVSVYASRYSLDVREVIIALTKKSKIDALDSDLEEICSELASYSRQKPKSEANSSSLRSEIYAEKKLSKKPARKSLSEILNGAASRSKKKSVLNLVSRPSEPIYSTGIVYEGQYSVFTSIGVDPLASISSESWGSLKDIDYFMIDLPFKSMIPQILQQITDPDKRVFYYDDQDFLLNELVQLVETVVGVDAKLTIIGSEGLPTKTYERLSSQFFVSTSASTTESFTNTVVVLGRSIGMHELYKIPTKSILIDYRAGTLNSEQVEYLTSKNVLIMRLNAGNSLAQAIDSRILMREKFQNTVGSGFYNGISVSSGNLISERGTIIVDNYRNPSKVIGIADGIGRLIEPDEYSLADSKRLKDLLSYISQTEL